MKKRKKPRGLFWRVDEGLLYSKRIAMEPFNFNELPEVVRQLFEKVERIEMLMARLEPKEPDENEILNIEEAAEFLKVSVGALYSKVNRQEIPTANPANVCTLTALT